MFAQLRQWGRGLGFARAPDGAAPAAPPPGREAALKDPDARDDGPDNQGGERPVVVSRALAARTLVGAALEDLADAADGATPAAGPATSTACVTIPGVPNSVPTRGVEALDRWAAAAEGAAAGKPHVHAGWLPAWLEAHHADLRAAACAADFLGARDFTQAYLEVQLRRVAMACSAQSRGRQAHVVPRLASLTEADYALLSCAQPPEPAAGDAAAAAATAQDAAVQTEPASPPQQHAAGADAAAAVPGVPPPPPALRPPELRVPVWEFEELVAAVVAGDLLTYTGATEQDVRRGLYAAGLRPTLATERADAHGVSGGRVAYLRLLLRPTRWQGALDAGNAAAAAAPTAAAAAAAAKRYEVAAVTLVADAHDQGWSSYPQDHGTYANSWTWGELALLDEQGGHVGLAGGAPRAYTNLHAESKWQHHHAHLGPDSALVACLNAHVFGPGAAAARRQEQQQQQGQQQGGAQEVAAQAGPAPGGGQRQRGEWADHQLLFLVCAQFPGWEHSVRRAELRVDLRPCGA